MLSLAFLQPFFAIEQSCVIKCVRRPPICVCSYETCRLMVPTMEKCISLIPSLRSNEGKLIEELQENAIVVDSPQSLWSHLHDKFLPPNSTMSTEKDGGILLHVSVNSVFDEFVGNRENNIWFSRYRQQSFMHRQIYGNPNHERKRFLKIEKESTEILFFALGTALKPRIYRFIGFILYQIFNVSIFFNRNTFNRRNISQ